MYGRPAIAAAFLALSLGLAQAAPKSIGARSIADCESIAEPDAYNKCLASFGPTARSGGKVRLAPGPHARNGRTQSYQRARQGPARRDGVTVERKGGRVRAIIDLRRR